MTEPVDVWSGSSLNTFLRCAAQWEFSYVYRIKRPPRLRMALGSAAHYAVETDLRQKITSHEDLPIADVLDAFSTSYDVEAAESEPEKDTTRPQMKDHGIKSVRFWHQKVAPLRQPKMVEQPISFRINDIPWTGTIDDVDDDGLVVDHKFTNRTPTGAEAYVVNMVGYALGYRTLTGELESRVQLDNIVGLKTETRYVPIRSDGPVPDESIQAFSGILEGAQRSINAGIFMPTGLKSGACSWCGYRDICPAFKASPMGRHYEDNLEEELSKSLQIISATKDTHTEKHG